MTRGPDVTPTVAAEHRRLLIEHGRRALLATVVALAVLGANAVLEIASVVRIVACLAVGVALVAAHTAIVVADRRHPTGGRTWSAWPLALVHGVAWALIAALVWPPGREEQLLFLAYIVAWAAVVAMASAPFVGHAAVVIVPPLAVTSGRFLAEGGADCVAVAIGVAAYGVALLVLHRHASRALLDAIRLRLENDARNQELHRLSITDPLTGVGNRRVLEARLEAEVARPDRNRPSTLAVLDLDRFKQVNDRLGHGAGDELLSSFARILSSGLDGGGSDVVVARTGGEEFAVVMGGVGANDAVDRLDAVRRTVANELWVHDQAVTVSIGVHQLRAGDTVSQSLESADIALYRAKRNGRNCVVRSTA